MGIHPSDIKTPEDFCLTPLIKKSDIRENLHDMISRKASLKDLSIMTTGGSTGHVLKLYHQRNIPRAAIGWRMMKWWGLTPDTDSAWIWRVGQSTFLNRVMLKLIEWPSSSIRLNAARIDEESILTFIKKYNASKIQLIHGYAGAVDHLASFILEHKLSVRSPKAVSVTSSPITKIQEKRIEDAFGAPVYDQYGCCEVFWLAAQCKKKKGLHRFHDTRRIEFIDNNNSPSKPGTEGRIVITNLEAFYFPIIRYVVGDFGTEILGECDCGVKLPLMKKVTGRVTETINLPDGTSVSGDFLTTIFDDFPDAVKQFQVHQQKNGAILIRLVPAFEDKELNAILEKIIKKFQTTFNNQVKIEFVKVDSIPHIRGKLVYIISDYKG